MNIPQQRLLVSILAIPTIVYTQFFLNFRGYDEYGIAIPLISSALIILVVRDAKFLKFLVPFYAYSLFILVLSIYNIMPSSWTHYRDDYAAIRQWSWLPIFTLSATTFYYFSKFNWEFIKKNSLYIFIFLFIVSRIVRYYTTGIKNPEEDFFLYGLDNDNALIFVMMSIYILFTAKTKKISLLAGIVLIILCSSATSKMAAGMVVFMLFARQRALFLAGLATMSAVFVLVAPHYFAQLHNIDPNSSFRALLWRDAGRAIVETNGIGVGFGTEYIRNDFREIPAEFKRLVTEGASDRLFIGTHSSVYDITMRVGFVGFIFLVMGLWRSLRGRILDERYQRLYFGLLGAIFINNTFNMGLVSINFTFATSAFFSIVLLSRDVSSARAPRRNLPKGQQQRRVRNGTSVAARPIG